MRLVFAPSRRIWGTSKPPLLTRPPLPTVACRLKIVKSRHQDNLIRLAIGLESVDDLKRDIAKHSRASASSLILSCGSCLHPVNSVLVLFSIVQGTRRVLVVKANAISQVIQQVNQVVLGKPREVKLAITCLIARGHLLIEDLPGMGKTTLANALARFRRVVFQRVQFTSDCFLPTCWASVFFVRIYRRSIQAGTDFYAYFCLPMKSIAPPQNPECALKQWKSDRSV